MDPLANPLWHALSGPQAAVAEGGPWARRFDPEISVFSAIPDDPTPASWEALAELAGPGQLVILLGGTPDPPDAWRVEFAGIGLQMVWAGEPGALAPVLAPGPAASVPEVERMGAGDVADMVELVERTEPGPFTTRTHELGTYLGVRDPSDRRLLALAGQRTRPPGHVEISAVCTDPDARGRGLARLLVARQIDEITASGEVPFLHVVGDNTGAIGLYRSMGFEVSREVRIAALSAPGLPDGPVLPASVVRESVVRASVADQATG